MIPPPDEFGTGAKLLCFAEVTDAVRPTGNTTHRRHDRILDPAKGLAICQYPGQNSFYLFYCDQNWQVLSDTFHLSLDDAKHQAEFEYEGISRFWRTVAI